MTDHDFGSPAVTGISVDLAAALEKDLFSRHGPLIGGEALRAALGYSSMDAFRQALVRKTVPVSVFSIANRRGKFALVKDVANWLATLPVATPVEPVQTSSGPDDG